MVILIQYLHIEYAYSTDRLFKCHNRNPPLLKFCSDLIPEVGRKISLEYPLFEFCQEVPLQLMKNLNENKKDIGNLGLFTVKV